MNGHARFEQLCALSAAGQLDPSAEALLGEHLLACASCGQLLHSFRALGAHLLVQDKRRYLWSRAPKGMTERFLARARAEGIPFLVPERKLETPKFWKATVGGCLAGLLLVTGLFFEQQGRRTSVVFPATQVGDISTPTKEVLVSSVAAGDRRPAKRVVARVNTPLRKARLVEPAGTMQEGLLKEWRPPVWRTVSAPPLLGVSREQPRALTWKMPSLEEIAAIGKPNHLLLTQAAQRKETIFPSPEFARLVLNAPGMQK